MQSHAHRSPSIEQEGENRKAPPGEVVYEAIYREGAHELGRGSRALAWSGLSAGLSMGFSFVAEALLRRYLPESRWTPTVAKFGYSLGFLIVILGRQQLFTKNTLTVILPLFNRRGRGERSRLRDVARLWAVVLAANLVGAALFAWLLAATPAFDSPTRNWFERISAEELLVPGFGAMLVRGMIAGWLIALMIWLLPFAESARVWVIVAIAYLVGLGHLPHVIAGSVAAFYGVIAGSASVPGCLVGFVLPTLLGNVIGGVAMVAALAHAEFVGPAGRE